MQKKVISIIHVYEWISKKDVVENDKSVAFPGSYSVPCLVPRHYDSNRFMRINANNNTWTCPACGIFGDISTLIFVSKVVASRDEIESWIQWHEKHSMSPFKRDHITGMLVRNEYRKSVVVKDLLA